MLRGAEAKLNDEPHDDSAAAKPKSFRPTSTSIAGFIYGPVRKTNSPLTIPVTMMSQSLRASVGLLSLVYV